MLKLTERLKLNAIDVKKCIHKNQRGFTQGRSTQENIKEIASICR